MSLKTAYLQPKSPYMCCICVCVDVKAFSTRMPSSHLATFSVDIRWLVRVDRRSTISRKAREENSLLMALMAFGGLLFIILAFVLLKTLFVGSIYVSYDFHDNGPNV